MANTNTKRAEEAIILTMRTNTISYCIEYNQADERNSFSAFLCKYFDIVSRLVRSFLGGGDLCKFCRYLSVKRKV